MQRPVRQRGRRTGNVRGGRVRLLDRQRVSDADSRLLHGRPQPGLLRPERNLPVVSGHLRVVLQQFGKMVLHHQLGRSEHTL